MADNTTKVIYKAIADFSAVSRAARRAKREIAELRREEARLNAQSVAGAAASTVATGKHAKAREELVEAFEAEAGAVRKSTARFLENAKAAREDATAKDVDTQASNRLSESIKKVAVETTKWKKNADGSRQVIERNGKSVRRNREEINSLGEAFNRTVIGAKKLDRQFDRLRNWRPRLIPPFIALIPVIGGLLALINPLVAGLGAVGAAGLGLASSLGRVGAAAIGIIPALTTIISLVAAMKVAFGGIGNAFKAFGKMKEATGGGGGSPAKAELTQAEELTRAQEAYARSIQDVAWAQEDLDDARKGYIKRLRELQKAVDRAAMSEARAAANSQLARENYANVLADPGSTKGQKMDAKVGVDEAQADYQDVIDQNLENQAALLKMQQDGIDGDRQVIQATRALTDAINRQRDAELDLINTQNGANKATGGGASALAEYERMLAKLSPSARRFVETLVGMSDAWTAVKKNVQEAFFSEFVDDVARLRDLLPSVQSLLSDTAGAMGRVVGSLLDLITSPEWHEDLILIGEQNVPIIERFGAGLISLLDAFKDLSIAAGPFLAALGSGFQEGAKNFADMVADARADGSLASYLEDVRERLGQWWRIIKNIGKTIFNFSAAASDFGSWLTDGFEKMTEGWLNASEEARKEGSPFQQYLEDIKPLLTEVKNLFAEFFSWFGKTASDPENIKAFTDIIYTIRTELGPALGKIFDILTKSGVGQDLVDAVTSIVEAIAEFLENGGVDGVKAFWTTIKDLADAFKTFIGVIPEPVLSLLSTVFGVLAALTFTGLTNVLGLLTKIAGSSTVLKFLDKLPLIGAAATSTGKHAAGAGSKAGGLGGLLGGGKGGGAKGGGGRLGALGGTVAKAGAVGAIVYGVVDSLDRISNVGKEVGDNWKDLTSGNFDDFVKASDNIGKATIKSNPFFTGSAVNLIDDVLGTDLGGIWDGWIDSLYDDFFPKARDAVANFFSKDLPQMVSDLGSQIWDGLQGLGEWLGEQWANVVSWFEDLPYNIGLTVGFLWGQLQNFGDWLAEQWTNVVTWFQDLPVNAARAAGDIWRFFLGLGPWLAARWTEFVGWLQNLPVNIANFAGDIWRNIQGIGGWLATQWSAFLTWLQDVPNKISRAVGNFWDWAFGGVTQGAEAGYTAARRHNGGPIHRAGGGGVPGRGNSDTVPAMLMPGEFVVRKSIVSRVGIENLTKFNAGVMSYAELLQSAMSNLPSGDKQKSDGGGLGGVSFFDGGGLVNDFNFGNGNRPPGPDFGGFGPGGGGGGMTFGDVNIFNPAPEPASDSLPRTIRKVAYLGSKR